MTPRFASLAAAALVVATVSACPRPPPSKGTPEEVQLTEEVRALSREAEALLKRQQEMLWLAWTQGAPVDIAKTYEGRPPLFTVESIRKIDRLRQLTHDDREIRSLTYLHAHFVGEYLSAQLAEVTDAIANLEASLTFPFEGREIPYRDLERQLANEKSAERRHALYEAATPAVQRLSASVRRKDERIQALIKELGYTSYEAFGAELRQADLERLGLLAEQILQVTQKPFTEVMGKLSQKELQLPLEKLRRADVPRLFRPKGVDALFPKDSLVPRAEATLKGLGIELSKVRGLQVDFTDRQGKNARPLTLPVEIPGDVRMSFKPAAGVREQAELLHELGIALHFGFSTESRFELAKLGNSAVTESYAYLFEDLIEDPVWLEEHAGLSGDKLAQYLAATGAHKLYLVRRAAGRLLYELQARRRDPQDAPALYSALMARTYGFPMSRDDQERYLLDQEDFYESADDFRAWFVAGQLQGQLKARFGPHWWRSREAGEFLESLWAKGNALTVRELVRLAGEENLEPDVLLLRLGTTLQVPITLGKVITGEPPPTPPPVPETADGGTPDAG